MVYVVIYIVIGVVGFFIDWLIFGSICESMNKKKGYEGGFWWGLLGAVGVIVIACRSESPSKIAEHFQQYENAKRRAEFAADIWTCMRCGRINQPYSSGCICGTTREESDKIRMSNMLPQKNKVNQLITTNKNSDENKEIMILKLDVLKKYKQLLDMDIITPEEFENKKRQVLSDDYVNEQNLPPRVLEAKNIGGWKCSKCGMANNSNRGTCYYCGAFNPKKLYVNI